MGVRGGTVGGWPDRCRAAQANDSDSHTNPAQLCLCVLVCLWDNEYGPIYSCIYKVYKNLFKGDIMYRAIPI